ncbi:hypothetical protein CPB83DRAFT_902277 [Crepidotus variabilis]|uniref:Uncharacterized protein n=1 Tax=Crepidotus variabilis TaxID=179855 RepID=A0A9P6JVT8_9AGAR|nr:hypothetical protein CPB83DRAFT_902277 [Crepidotus variabilis]
MSTVKDLQVFMRLLMVLCFLGIVVSIPTWDPFFDQTTVDNLVPGGSHIESNVPSAFRAAKKQMSVQTLGRPGNVTINNHLYEPPVFYVFKRQLWYMNNESTIWPVNMRNSSTTHPLPMQLVVEEKQGGIPGTWRWEGSMLNFDLLGKKSPVHRLFFVCLLNNSYNVFFSPSPTPRPDGCEITTLHSFVYSSVQVHD